MKRLMKPAIASVFAVADGVTSASPAGPLRWKMLAKAVVMA